MVTLLFCLMREFCIDTGFKEFYFFEFVELRIVRDFKNVEANA
jgi:hypothetical protein